MHDIRDRHAASRPWTISACWVVLGAVVLAQYAATVAGRFGLQLAAPWGGGALWYPGLAPVVALAGFAVLWPHRGRAGQKPLWDATELKNAVTWAALGITVSLNLLLVLLFQGSISAGAFLLQMPMPVHILMWFGNVFMTPILVEWMFRGILQPTLAQRVDSPVAILLTAVVAAFLQGGVLELCQNLLWGWVSAGRRSLLVPVVAHGLYAAWLLGRLYAG